MTVILIIVASALLLFLIVIGICVLCGSANEVTRIMDDFEQERYIREWNEKHKRK